MKSGISIYKLGVTPFRGRSFRGYRPPPVGYGPGLRPAPPDANALAPKQKTISRCLLALACILPLLISCAGTAPPSSKAGQNWFPEWVLNPPFEENAVYGIGGDTDPGRAQLKALADIAWQISVQVNSVSIDTATAASTVIKEQTASIMGTQMAKATVRGAKFVEEEKMPTGETWVLARMPLECVLDITESAMITYSLQLELEPEEILARVEEVNKKLATERVPNPGIETPENVPAMLEIRAAGRPVTLEDTDLNQLYARRTELQQRLTLMKKQRKTRTTAAWITLPLGLIAGGLAVYGAVDYTEVFAQYDAADNETDMYYWKDKAKSSHALAWASGSVGVGLTGFGTVMALAAPGRKTISRLETELASVSAKILAKERGL